MIQSRSAKKTNHTCCWAWCCLRTCICIAWRVGHTLGQNWQATPLLSTWRLSMWFTMPCLALVVYSQWWHCHTPSWPLDISCWILRSKSGNKFELFLFMKSGFVDHQCISCWALFLAQGTHKSRWADMLCLNVVLYMWNLLRTISALRALPTATLILEHEVVHQDVQALYSLSIGS